MTTQFQLEDILFFDIETVSLRKKLSDLSEEHREEWRLKSRFLLRKFDEDIEDDELEEVFEDRAAIFAEFGKIICISAGFVRNGSLRIKSFAGDHERAQKRRDQGRVEPRDFQQPQGLRAQAR